MIPVADRSRARARLRPLVPAATIFLSALLMALPLPLAWGVMPHYALLFLIIWSGLQPRMMPIWAALALGLLTDLMAGLPLGVNGLIFPLVLVIVRMLENRLESPGVWVDWTAASLVILLAFLGQWRAMAFVGRDVPFAPLSVQAILTILGYPLAVAIAARMQRRLIAGGD